MKTADGRSQRMKTADGRSQRMKTADEDSGWEITADEDSGWGKMSRDTFPYPLSSSAVIFPYLTACASAMAPSTPAMLPRPGGTM